MANCPMAKIPRAVTFLNKMVLIVCRRVLEPPEASLPTPKRPGAPRQKPGGKGGPDHREEELCGGGHDHPPPHRPRHQEQTRQKGDFETFISTIQ